jgi:hypothetical protein
MPDTLLAFAEFGGDVRSRYFPGWEVSTDCGFSRTVELGKGCVF